MVLILYLKDGFGAVPQLPQPATGNFMTMRSSVISPTSRRILHFDRYTTGILTVSHSGGNLTLASSNPFDKPVINPALLTTEFDIQTAVQSMKDVQTFVSGTAWNGFILAPFGDLSNVTTDELKAAYARKYTVSFFHPVGTAAMSPSNAKWGVVNPDLTLKGANKLRIVDASVFVSPWVFRTCRIRSSLMSILLQPTIPECHTQAVVYTVAERAADLIVRANS